VPIYDQAAVRLGDLVHLLHPAGHIPAPRYRTFFDAMAIGKEQEALRKLGNYFVTPTDDQPYYILGTFFEAMNRGEKVHPAIGLLMMSTKVIGFASLVLILLPVFFVRRRDNASVATMLRTVVYFFSIGAGFMLLEIGLIHKATVFVSTPGAAVAVVMSSILVPSGIGARMTDLLKWRLHVKLLFAVGSLVVLSIIYKLVSGPLFDSLFGLPLWLRCITAAVVLAPVGFFMGWFFPIGLRSVGGGGDALVPWAISVNGFASVVGSLATLFLGLKLGLTGVFAVALIGYVIAGMAMFPEAIRASKVG